MDNLNIALIDIEKFIQNIRNFMLLHNLKLNDSKTAWTHPTIRVGNTDVPIVEKVSNMGITIDSNLNLKQHITYICKKSHFKLTKIKQHQKYLSRKNKKNTCKLFF